MVYAKKEVICDYCGSSNEPGQMLSAKKAYFGSKVSDVLHAITQRQIPSTLAIKVCFICFSKFVQCERTIQKIQEFVDQSLSPSAGKKKNAKGDEPEVLIEEVKKKKPMKKRSFSVPGLGTLQPSTIIEESPSKRSKGKTDSDILDNSVVLKPAKAIDNKKNNSVLDIFGPKATTAADSEQEEEEEESDSEDAELPHGSVLIPEIFECRRCDFKVKQQKKMKQHYMQVHGQQRPRIFYCPICPKSFGVAKTLKNHAKSAHGIEEPAKEKSGAGRAKTVEKEVPAAKKGKKSKVDVEVEVEIKDVAEVDKDAIKVKGPKSPLKGQTSLLKKQTSSSAPQTPVKPIKTPLKPQTPVNQLENGTSDQSSTVIRALNEHKSKKKDVTNTEYTFAINDSSASTPKQNGEPMPSGGPLICTVCGAEQPSVKTMIRHMSTTHGIDKPKIFQCNKCEKSLASKQSLNYHMAWHLGNPEAEVSPKRQILQEDGPPSKRNKAKESADESNVADQAEASSKKSKKLSETTNNDVADGISSAKKIKKLSETTNDVAVSSPKKFKKISESTNDVTESPLKKSQKEPTVSLLSDDEKWIFPRPKKSKKERKESEAANISNGNGLNKSPNYPLDDMAEINPTVQPHKREMLTSTCESTTADESEFNCSQCPKSSKSQRRLESHIAKMHGKSLKCSNCYKKFPTRQTYVVHFGECEGEDLDTGLPCGVRKCTKIFETVTYLEDHLKKRHQW